VAPGRPSAPKAGQAHGFSCNLLISLKKVLLKIQSFQQKGRPMRVRMRCAAG
jgi:hypothetical protein